MIFRLLTFIILFAFINIGISFGGDKPYKSVTAIKDFKLLNTNGKSVSLSDFKKAKGFIIVFTCNHCPFAKLYPDRMNYLNLKYSKFCVPLIAISSTDTNQFEEDNYPEMIRKSRKEKFNFPYLKDKNQEVAKNFSAQKTPHAFIIWREDNQWKVKYSGAIDDNGAEPNQVTEKYLELALDQLLQNKNVKIKETKSIGCQIHYR